MPCFIELYIYCIWMISKLSPGPPPPATKNFFWSAHAIYSQYSQWLCHGLTSFNYFKHFRGYNEESLPKISLSYSMKKKWNLKKSLFLSPWQIVKPLSLLYTGYLSFLRGFGVWRAPPPLFAYEGNIKKNPPTLIFINV